jgi:sarcosine oxidase
MSSNSYDVIVVGLGAMGSATAYELAQRGSRVLGLERFTPAHSFGSSHGRSRIIRQAYMEHPDYVPLVLRAYELWEKIERDAQQHLLTRTGGLMLGPSDSQVVAGSLESAKTYQLAHEMLDSAEIRRRYPMFHTKPDTIGLYAPNDGFLVPEACIQAYLSQAERYGAELHYQEPIVEWKANEHGVEVRTERGQYQAEKLVLTVGAWAPQLLQDLGLPLQVERRVLYWFQPLEDISAFAPERFPIYIWEYAPGEDFYGFPAQGGEPGGLKVAFHTPIRQSVCTPETIDRTVYPEEIAAMRALLAEFMPSLNGELLSTATCMYTLTPDQHFVIGKHPQYERVVLASPCSGHGFKFASVIGEILADLARDGTTRQPIELFNIERFAR